jgi:putative flippase GtrA
VNRQLRGRLLELIRFCIVGGLSTILYFGVYSVLVLLGLSFGLATLGGWGTSVAFGFVMHHRFTFRTGQTGATGFWRWLGLQTVVLLVNFAGLSLLVRGVGLGRITAQLGLLPLIPLLTFFLSRRFIFVGESPLPENTERRSMS